MKIPTFWARQTVDGMVAYGWSFNSQEEAEENARAHAREIATRYVAGTLADRGKMYYANRPVREPIMREFRDAKGDVDAILTRNVYGALVLNTAKALFVDVDFPAPPKPPILDVGTWVNRLKSLFAPKSMIPRMPESQPLDPVHSILTRATEWQISHPGWHWRIYRTKAGIRLLATHALFEPGSKPVDEVFAAMGADPLYRKLCSSQQCFRARLTPKPWRCGYIAPGIRWPFAGAAQEATYAEWENGYLEKCKEWATCDLLQAGSDEIHPELSELVKFHDAASRVGSNLPLA